jgi:CheY-like chemotaxis protein
MKNKELGNYKQGSILLVEDNEDDILLTKRSFNKNKIANQLIVVRNGEEAFDYLNRKGKYKNKKANELPILILLDIEMPKMNGIKFLKELQNKEKLKHIPVVILTASDEEKDIISSYKYNVNSYIIKPVDFDQFTRIIKQLGMYWLVLNELPNQKK